MCCQPYPNYYTCTYLHAYGNEGINFHSDGGTCAAVGDSYECQ